MDGLPILLVSASPETSLGMRRYLEGAGARVTVASAVVLAAEPGPRAIVLFADDFPATETEACLRGLERRRDGPVVVLVSADPSIAAGRDPGGDGLAIVRIPRPAWSWSVLDAIRGLLAERRDERESP